MRFGLKVHSKQPCRQQFQKTRRTTMERDGCCCCCCWRSCRRGRVVGFALTVWWICLRFWLAGFVAPVEVTARSGHEVTLPCDVDVAACGGFHSIKWYRQAQRVFVYSELANLERSEGTLQNRSGPLSISPSIRLSIYPSIFPSIDLLIDLPMDLCMCMYLDIDIFLRSHLFTYPSMYPCIHLSIHFHLFDSLYVSRYRYLST